MAYPSMAHIKEFWDGERWADDKWEHYQKRLKKRGGFREWLDQRLHQLMGRFVSRKRWEKREAKQWPSKTGSYDPCRDHYHWLCGAGHFKEAAELEKKPSEGVLSLS